VVGLVVLLVAGGGAWAAWTVHERRQGNQRQRDVARDFVAAWVRGDTTAMWKLTGGKDRPAQAAFERSYAQSRRAAGVDAVKVGRRGPLDAHRVRVPVTVRTDDFGTLFGYVTLRTADLDGKGVIRWSPEMRLPGLRKGEAVRRREGKAPERGEVLASNGTRLAADAIGAGIAGDPNGDGGPTGLERLYDERLAGHPSESLRFGDRTIRRVKARKGRNVHSTVQLGLSHAAQDALGDRQGGVAVIRPRDGAVLALAGLAVSAPQPPGSTFKIVTLSAALQHKVASPSDSFPVRQSATLSGVALHNASNESCGGSLAVSFADSCNSVFGPLGAKLGRKRLVRMAEKFGFNEQPRVPAAKVSSIARDLKDSLAVGAAAIGQERDLATPLQMASVGATIANRGVRVRPRIVREAKVVRRRVVRSSVASTVRDMMIGVVSGGTGTAAALPGVTVAGKTGTAELVETHGGTPDPKNTDAWFVAFAPAGQPKVAVAVMLVGAGAGGAAAAPVARRVLQAAL
jgi:penicillin-binding protein A